MKTKSRPFLVAIVGGSASGKTWLAGQLQSAELFLTLIQSPLFSPGGMFPELAFYDCHACHHPMEKKRWPAQRADASFNPGSLRLQGQSLVMLQAVLEALGTPEALAQLRQGTDELIRAGLADPGAVRAAAQKLLEQLHGLESWTRRAYAPAEVAQVRRMLLHYAAQDKADDYAVAEQVVMAVESLSYSLADRASHKASLDALFATVKNGSDFNAAQFGAVAKRVQEQF